MRFHSGLAGVLCAVFAAGCVKQIPIRASSSRHLKPEQAKVDFQLPPDQLQLAVKAAFTSRGFALANALDAPDGSKLLVFTADRKTLTSLHAGGGVVMLEQYDIGSWMAARVRAFGPGSQLILFGKPQVSGHALCSDDDASLSDVQYWCQDTQIREDSTMGDMLSGRTEAEIVVGVVEELKDRLGRPAKAPPGATTL